MKNPIDIVIRAITKPFQDGMNAAADASKKFGTETQKAGEDASKGLDRANKQAKETGKGFGASLGSVVKGVVSNFANIHFLINDVIGALKSLTSAWLEQETTTTRLNSAIKKSGQNLSEASEAMSKYTAHMQAAGVSESVVEESLIRLTRSGLDYEKAIRLNNAAMALSYEKFGSFETGATAAEKALIGATKGAKMLGVEIDAGASALDVYNAFVKKAGDTTATFGDYSKTATGRINALKEVTGEAKEAIGKGLVGGFLNATGTGKDFNKNVEKTINWLNKVAEVIAVWVVPGIKTFVSALVDWERVAATPLLNTLMALAAGFTSVYQAATGRIDEAKTSWLVMKNLITGIPSDMADGWRSAKKDVNDFFKNAEARKKQFDALGLSTSGLSSGGGGGRGREVIDKLTDAEKAIAKLKEYQIKAEREIIDGNLRDNAALLVKQKYLLQAVAALGKMKDSTDAVYEANSELNDIANKFADDEKKEAEELAKKWVKAEEARTKAALDEAEKRKKIAEDEARDIAEWQAESAKKRMAAEAEMSASREELARAGGNRGVLGGIFSGIFGGISDRISERNARKAIEDQIELNKRLAKMTGEAYDETAERIGMLLDAIHQKGKMTADDIKELQRLSRQKAAETHAAEAKKRAEEDANAIVEAQKRAAEEQYNQMHDMVASAFETGIDQGGKAGLKSLAENIAGAFRKKLVDAVTDAVLGGGTAGGGGIAGLLGGLSGRGGGTGSAAQSAGAFASGWGAMAPGANYRAGAKAGGGGGNFLSKIFAGGVGGALGFAGLALGVASLFSHKGQTPAQSGVQPIGNAGPTVRGTDWGALYGSDIFSRATFSARNQGNALLRERAGARMEPQSVIKIIPSKEFDAISESKTVRVMKGNDLYGVPKRTGFNQ